MAIGDASALVNGIGKLNRLTILDGGNGDRSLGMTWGGLERCRKGKER